MWEQIVRFGCPAYSFSDHVSKGLLNDRKEGDRCIGANVVVGAFTRLAEGDSRCESEGSEIVSGGDASLSKNWPQWSNCIMGRLQYGTAFARPPTGNFVVFV